MPSDPVQEYSCPLPFSNYPNVLLAHGGGGRLSHQLIKEIFLPHFTNEFLASLHDGAAFDLNGTRLAFSTDAYVVQPLFFPGGSIGELAVNGTVNDLSMCGARPLYLSAAFIIEEGFPMDDLRRVAAAMQEAARQAGVLLVTGDTKVVDRGKGDGLFITTSGIGVIAPGVDIAPHHASPGDQIILSGPIGLHGIAIMSVREGLQFETSISSDTAPLNGLVSAMLESSKEIHVLRDPTRGGVATTLNEIAASANIGIVLDETAIPVPAEVSAACEILGLDPLYVANEGKLLAVVPPGSAGRILDVMHSHPLGQDAVIVGTAVADHPAIVTMNSRIGGTRVVDMMSGEQLPRIC